MRTKLAIIMMMTRNWEKMRRRRLTKKYQQTSVV
jgi:hypothetical protein